MEKLYELVNEFIKEKNILIMGGSVYNLDMDYFITKKAGFIERLVENDKIDFVKKNEDGLEFNWQIMDDCMDTFDDYPVDTDTGELSDDCTDMLIMILSIKDNPIEYLCSILK